MTLLRAAKAKAHFHLIFNAQITIFQKTSLFSPRQGEKAFAHGETRERESLLYSRFGAEGTRGIYVYTYARRKGTKKNKKAHLSHSNQLNNPRARIQPFYINAHKDFYLSLYSARLFFMYSHIVMARV